MAYILSIDTTTRVCSVSVSFHETLLSITENYVEKAHARNLLHQINHTLYLSQIELGRLSAIAISEGPGSYTGLRIGTSTVKGLCYSHNIPLIAVDTMAAMAYEVNKVNFNRNFVCPMIDARRLEVYCSIFSSDGDIVLPLQAEVLTNQSFSKYLNENHIIFFGDGASKFKEIINSVRAHFIDNIWPSAKNISSLAYKAYLKSQFADLIYFEPKYLKEFTSIT